MDTVTKEVRSRIMASVKGKNTSIEVMVFKLLKKLGIKFRKHYAKLPGRPDAVILKQKIAVFVDGDFWHGYRYPAWRHRISSAFWRNKIETNRRRDQRNFRALRRAGWKVVRIWGHEIKKGHEDLLAKKLPTLLAR